MPKSPPKDYYASVMFPGTKKLSIVSRRLGSKERLHAIATVTSETVADKIVEALNHHQGAIATLESPLLKLNEELRDMLSKAKAEYNEMRQKNNGLLHDVDRLKRELERAIRERDAAQKVARENSLVPNHPVRAM